MRKKQLGLFDARMRFTKQNLETYQRLADKRRSEILEEKKQQMLSDGYDSQQIEAALDQLKNNVSEDRKINDYMDAVKMYQDELTELEKEKQIHKLFLELIEENPAATQNY